MHVLINLSWRCQLSCSYCLIPHIKVNREAKEHPWTEWATGINRHVTPGSVVDVAGGDPLLFDGLAYFLHSLAAKNIYWAITTNALSTLGVAELLAVKPGNCALVNISDHPGNADAAGNIARLQDAFPVVFNRVAHPRAGHHLAPVSSIIPYQRY